MYKLVVNNRVLSAALKVCAAFGQCFQLAAFTDVSVISTDNYALFRAVYPFGE